MQIFEKSIVLVEKTFSGYFFNLLDIPELLKHNILPDALNLRTVQGNKTPPVFRGLNFENGIALQADAERLIIKDNSLKGEQDSLIVAISTPVLDLPNLPPLDAIGFNFVAIDTTKNEQFIQDKFFSTLPQNLKETYNGGAVKIDLLPNKNVTASISISTGDIAFPALKSTGVMFNMNFHHAIIEGKKPEVKSTYAEHLKHFQTITSSLLGG